MSRQTKAIGRRCIGEHLYLGQAMNRYCPEVLLELPPLKVGSVA
ncbi:MAG: hypothetical protein RR090_05690 [Niameybacter sp.]